MFARTKALNWENSEIELEKRISELDLQNEALDREIESLLAEQKVSSRQLTYFLSKASHFTDGNWERLQKEKKKVEEKLERDLKNIKKKHRSRESLKTIQPNWLFVR